MGEMNFFNSSYPFHSNFQEINIGLPTFLRIPTAVPAGKPMLYAVHDLQEDEIISTKSNEDLFY